MEKKKSIKLNTIFKFYFKCPHCDEDVAIMNDLDSSVHGLRDRK